MDPSAFLQRLLVALLANSLPFTHNSRKATLRGDSCFLSGPGIPSLMSSRTPNGKSKNCSEHGFIKHSYHVMVGSIHMLTAVQV
jgi:hypothetical protein